MKNLFQVYFHYLAHGNFSPQTCVDARITAALDKWMRQKKFLTEGQNIHQTARSLGVNAEQLSFYCRSVLRVPFLTWRKELRIREAMNMLQEDPDMPLSLVGMCVGIKSKSNFRRQFSDVAGCPPRDWMKKNGLIK